jgi:uncharacterized membrane protein YfcA
VGQVVGNGARVGLDRRELVWPVVGRFSQGAVPLAVLGGGLFATAPAPILQRLFGVFLLVAAAFRHTARGRRARITLRGSASLGIPRPAALHTEAPARNPTTAPAGACRWSRRRSPP